MNGFEMEWWPATLSETRARAAVEARRFGVPPTMIDAAARRRSIGDWRGACAAADVDVHLNPDTVRRRHGAGTAERLLADLRNLAPDLLRWHLPRYAHGPGRLREGLLVPLADYGDCADYPGSLTLAAATPRFALAAGQRIVLILLESGERRSRGCTDPASRAVLDGVRRKSAERYCLRRHRMFWDATCAGQLERLCAGPCYSSRPDAASSRDEPSGWEITRIQDHGQTAAAWSAAGITLVDAQPQFTRWLATVPVNLPRLAHRVREALPGVECAVIRTGGGAVVLRGLALLPSDGGVTAEPGSARIGRDLPVVPEAAWTRPVDADLLRFDLIGPDELHPLVAAALAPDAAAVRRTSLQPDEWRYRTVPGIETQCTHSPSADPDPDDPDSNNSHSDPDPHDADITPITVRCGCLLHRVAKLDGHWQPVDHPGHLARELRFARLGGPPNPCLQAAQYLNAGRHIVDLVESLMEHGRTGEAVQLLTAHADARTASAEYVLPEGSTIGEALDSLRQNTLRLRMILSGAVPPRDTRSTRVPSARCRRSRKGEPARLPR